MELSPPALTRSPSISPSQFPVSSPDSFVQQYKITPDFDTTTTCGLMSPDSAIRSSVSGEISQSAAGWNSPSSILAPSTNNMPAAISSSTTANILGHNYDGFSATYSESSIHHYDMYAPSNTDTHSTGTATGSPAPIAATQSPYSTPFDESIALPTRMKEDAREAYAAATASLESVHFVPSARPITSAAAPFITDVYGPPHSHAGQNHASYMMDHSAGHHQAHQHQQHHNPFSTHTMHHSPSPQTYYLPPPAITSHGDLPHELLMSSSAPSSTHASSTITESIMVDRRLRLHTRRAPRRLTTKEEANFQCTIKGCGKLFSRSYNYKAHLETHDEKREYPFLCQVPDCTKKFVRKTDLQRHTQSVHEKQRNHPCGYCGRKFARKDTLRRHMEDGCSKRFDLGSIDLQAESAYNPIAFQQQRMMSASHSLPTLPSSQQQLPGIGMSSVSGFMQNSDIPRTHNMHGWAP